MSSIFRPRTLVLFVGDVVFFTLSLWLSLWLRTFEIPSQLLLIQHLVPFSLLFIAWVLVYLIAGLYESRSVLLARRAFSSTLLVAQVFNMVLAALFFFFVPLFGIAPKTLLFIYMPVSFALVLLWRVFLFPLLGLQSRERAIVVGDSLEALAVAHALRNAHQAPTTVVSIVEPGMNMSMRVRHALEESRARIIIADFNNGVVAGAFPELYNLLAQGVRFYDATGLYEELFGRIALNTINDSWIARNVSRSAHLWYDSLKRVIDLIVSLPAAIVSLALYPVIILIIKLQDGGPIFYTQLRVGEGNQLFPMYKFRSMTGADQGDEVLKSRHTVTPFGSIMRKTRIDELPQLWSVVRGEMSLIGPRPEFPQLVSEYAKQIPYYNMRHLIKPGLSGWAQLYHDNHPHHGTDVEATREKLSFDLYYLKHRSLVLDVVVMLKTIKKLLTRSGV